MIEIPNRWSGAVIFRSETAATMAEAIAEMVTQARERDERANLSDANLSGANLSGANLSGADLSHANLSDADLSRANLSDADLSGADLSRADLSRANLSDADLSGANLSGANLSGADLSHANLSGADLSRADLSRANLISLGFDTRGYHFFLCKEGDALLITAGCRRFTLTEARAHWGQAHGDEPLLRAQILARLDMADVIAAAYGWTEQGKAARA